MSRYVFLCFKKFSNKLETFKQASLIIFVLFQLHRLNTHGIDIEIRHSDFKAYLFRYIAFY